MGAAVFLGVGPPARALPPVSNGLVVWLAASEVNPADTTQVRLAGEDVFVKQWNDGSGNNHHATNGTASDQPLYVASGANNMPTLRFGQDNEDNGDRLYLGDLSASFPVAGSVYAVGTIDNDGRYNLFGNRNNDERWVASTWSEAVPGSFRGGRTGTAYASWPQTGSHLFALESSSAAYRVLIDGTQIGSAGGDYNSGSGENWTVGNRATAGQQLRGDIPELLLYNRILTIAEAALTTEYLSGKYGLAMPLPLVPTGLTATPGNQRVNLVWAVTQGATSYTVWTKNNTTAVEQTETTTQTSFVKSGLENGVSYTFKVLATNITGNSEYGAEVSAIPVLSSAKEILTFDFGAAGAATITGPNIIKDVPLSTNVATLAPIYTVSPFALADAANPSGTTRDFTGPQTYTITAEDGTTKTYTVTVVKREPITYNFDDGLDPITHKFNDGLQGWTQIWPAVGNGSMWEGDHLGAGGGAGDNVETRFGRSPEFFLLAHSGDPSTGTLSCSLDGGDSPLAAPVGPSDIPELAIQDGGFGGMALRDVATNTYVLSKPRSGGNGGNRTFGFTVAELAPFSNDGKKYTLDYIDYKKGGWGWIVIDNVSIPGTLAPAANILTFSLTLDATIVGTNITLRVPFGTNVAALAPVFTMSPGAICDHASGSTTYDFTVPQTYTITSSDTLVSRAYTVAVVTLPDPATALVGHWISGASSLTDTSVSPPGTHDGTAIGGNAAALAYNADDVPLAFGGNSLDLRAGNVGVMIANSATTDTAYLNTYDEGLRSQFTIAFWAKGFPGTWAPWVSKRGEDGIGWQLRRLGGDPYSCFTIRGIDNEDGPGSTINVNDNPAKWHHYTGVWDQALGTRTLYVDGVLSHVVNNNPIQRMSLAAAKHLMLGARQQGGDSADYDGYFSGLLYDVRIYNQMLFASQVPTVMTTPTAPQPLEAKIRAFGLPGAQAIITGTNILWTLPIGSDRTNVAPTITLTAGATCVPASGVTRDFTTPQTYTVKSQDSAITTVYTVTTRVAGSVTVSTYDDTFGTANLAPLSLLQAITPNGSTVQSRDISYDGNFVGALPGLTNGDWFSVIWDGWFDVGEDGPGYYTFGTRSDDGSVLYLDLNNDGDFDDPGELIVNNNALQGATIRTATVFLPMDSVRFAIGYFEQDGGDSMEARCKKGSGLPYEELGLIGGNAGLFFNAQPPANPASAALWYLTYGTSVAKATGTTELLLSVPFGTDVTTLAPTFMVAPGATCTPPSGTARDFTTPQTYSVKSQDNSTTTVFTVTVYQSLLYDFNAGSLQGWHNRVWDLSANGGSGGWIELAPNATTFPATVNGGVSQPPSGDNGLYGVNEGAAWPNGNTDNHLNTLWLQSPAFYLDAAVDLTLQLGRGVANATDPTNEASVPFAAVTNLDSAPPGGWKGVVLRRVSDGAFLLARPRTGANGDEFRTVTFTAAEMTPFNGVACTVDLINSDRGGWGWIIMDNVVIPTTGLVPLSPFDAWRANYPDLVGAMGQPGADADGDGFTNLEEYAFGMDPMNGRINEIAYTGDSVTGYGQPKLESAGGYSAVFGQRQDRVAVGLTYTVQFSANVTDWVNSDVVPTVIANDSTIQAVGVAYPASIETPAGPAVPKFFRVKISQN